MTIVNKEKIINKIKIQLKEVGFNKKEIEATIRSWTYAQDSEKFTHGFERLPWLIKLVENKKIRPNSQFSYKKNKFMIRIIGKKSLGYLVAEEAVKLVIKLAKSEGIGIVTVYDSYPTGCMGQYTQEITENKLIGIAISSSPARVAPYQSSEAVFATMGHSFGFPSTYVPYIYDSSIGAVTNGEVLLCHKSGKLLPQNSVLSRNGKFETDTFNVFTNEVFDGVIAMAGGINSNKFSGLAGALELLTQLSLTEVNHKNSPPHLFFMSIDPSLFCKSKIYMQNVFKLEKEINNSKPIKPYKKVFFAGQKSYEKRKLNSIKSFTHISKETYNYIFGI